VSIADGILLTRAKMADRPRLLAAFPYLAIVVAGTIAFLPGLGAGFVSDDFNYVSWIRSTTPGGVLAQFLPALAQGQLNPFYRPLNDLLFWLEYQVFGAQPVAYHLVAFLCHLGIAVLLYRLALRLGVRMEAALAGAAAFLLSIHAHEVIFWWAAGHFAFGGLAIVAAVLAYIEGWTWLSLVFTVLALLTDEAGVALLPVLAVAEGLFGRPLVPAASSRPAEIARRLPRLAPTAAALVGYFGLRVSRGGFWSESDACHDPGCQALGLVEYVDRLFLRPGRLIELLRAYTTPNRLVVGAALLVVLAGALALLRAWRWRDWRVVAFGAAWCLAFLAVFLYGLWPYISDRFFYYPEMGLALALAGAVQQALRGWTRTSATRPARLATGAVLAGYAVWLALGVPTLWHRAGQWVEAGQTVSAIFDNTTRLEPNPRPGTVLVFADVPDTLLPDVPPGNTGPYLLRNGLTTGLRERYGRSDIDPIPATSAVPRNAPAVVCLDIVGDEVERAACPRQ